jgi:hypothetical protein
MPRSIRACRTVGNARNGPSSVRWVTFAIIAAHISPADNVLRNDKVPEDLRALGDRDANYDLTDGRPHDCPGCVGKPAPSSG